jgi:GxxExxY protein
MAATFEHVNPALTHAIIGSAITVHRALGPGLLESTYRACFVNQLAIDGLRARQETAIPLRYNDLHVDFAYRADIIVEDSVVVELKAVEALLPVHQAQLLTYLKHSGLRVGLLINFNVPQLIRGVRRFVM